MHGNKGKKWSDETRAKQMERLATNHPRWGKKHSEETRLQIGESARKQQQRRKALGLPDPRTGVKASLETRAKMSVAASARVRTNGSHWIGTKSRHPVLGIMFDSNWERCFALDGLEPLGLAYERGGVFEYRDKLGVLRRYNPDFAVVYNGQTISIEIKRNDKIKVDLRKMAAAVRKNPSLRVVVLGKQWLKPEAFLPLFERAANGERFVVCPYAEGPARIESFAEAHGTATIVAQAPAATTYNSCRSQALPGEIANSYSTEVSIGKGV